MKQRLNRNILVWFLLFALVIIAVNLLSLYQLHRIDQPISKELPKDVQDLEEMTRIEYLAHLIRYYDEVLTQSARNYAFTADKKWKERYESIESKLEQTIREAVAKGDEIDQELFKAINKANKTLVGLERQALELVEGNNQEKAVSILESKKYQENKDQYQTALDSYRKRREREQQKALSTSSEDLTKTINILNRITTQGFYLFAASLFLIFLVLFLFGRFLRNTISKPLDKLVSVIKKSGKQGKAVEFSSGLIKRKDEIGELAVSFQKMWQDLEETTVSKEKLKKSQMRFKALFESSRDAIMVTDPDSYRFSDANQATLDMFKAKNKQELFSRGPGGLSPLKQPDGSNSSQKAKRMIKKAVKEGTSIFEWVHKRMDGTTFPAQVRLTRMILEGKTVVQAIVRDVSQQKETENKLKERAKEFGCLSNLAEIVEEPGISLEEILAKTVEVIPPALQYSSSASARLRYEGKEYQTENFKETNCKLKEDIYVNSKKVGFIEACYSQSIQDEKGKCPFLEEENTLFRLIAERLGRIIERKKAEEFLEEAKNKFSSLVDNVPGAIYRCANDLKWTMNYVSDEIKTISGYSASDFIGNKIRTYESIIYKKDRNLVNETIQKAIQARKPYNMEYRIVNKDDKVKWVGERGKGIFNKDKELVWLDGVIFDISLQKEAKEKLETAIKIKSDFLSTVSHELRTPLAAIKEGINIVYDQSAGKINKEQKEFLDISKRNVDRLARLINDVLDIQKLESDKMEFDLKENDINSIIKEVFETMKPHVAKKQLQFKLNLDENIPKMKVDRDKLIQVITNLVSNAIKFTERGSVTINSLLEKNAAKVWVEDTGPGIKKEDIAKLFKTFQQLQTGKGRKTGGTGLGLAICKDIINKHRGKIWVESELGKGSKFIFLLPIKERRA
ncbi:MAG: ATP-binding protein [Candidatus Omnitrophota bacterium]